MFQLRAVSVDFITCKIMKKYFIGIDFSKKKFDAVILTHQDLNAEGEHSVFENNKSGFKRFVCWVKKKTGTQDGREVLICGENTGVYSQLASEYLYCAGYDLWIESGLQIKKSLGIRRGKDDHSDARDIAEYCGRHADKAKLYKPESKQIQALKYLFSHHRMLVKHKGDFDRRIGETKESIKDNPFLQDILQSYEELVAKLKEEIKNTIKKMLEIIKNTAELMKTYTIITGIKGIGPINAVAIIVSTNNFHKFGYNPRKLASYWGIAPFKKQSGTSLNGKPHVSGYAASYLKSLLSEAVLCATRYCPPINAYYERLKAKDKHPLVILNNCKNKLIHIIAAMVKNDTQFTLTPNTLNMEK